LKATKTMSSGAGKKPKRKLSKKALKAISRAQKKRWAKYKAEQKAAYKMGSGSESKPKKGAHVGNEREQLEKNQKREFAVGFAFGRCQALVDVASSETGGLISSDELAYRVGELLQGKTGR